MTNRTAAARYARALLDVGATESVDFDVVARDLDEFVASFYRERELQRVMLDPAVPSPRKRAAMEQIVQRSGLTSIVAKLLILLANRDRLGLLSDIAATYREQLDERRGVVHANVTSAEPLTPERTAAIEGKLAAVTGKRISLTTAVDKDLIGGLVAKVGGTVYDASVLTQLKKIKERLTT